MKRLALASAALATFLAGCATTVTAENVYSFSDLQLCRIQANPGSREVEETSLVDAELGRRETDCPAVFDEERRRVEEERRRQEEARRIAEEERRIYTERQVDRISMALAAWERPAAWRNREIPRNVSGVDLNACLRDDSTGEARPADVEPIMGDALNVAMHTREYGAYRQYAVVFLRNGDLMVLQMQNAFYQNDLPYGYVAGTDENGLTWGLKENRGYGC